MPAFSPSVSNNLAEIRNELTAINNRLHSLELREAAFSTQFTEQMKNNTKRLDEAEPKIETMGDTLIELRQTNKILSWLGGLLASAIILFLLTSFLNLL